MNTQKLLESCIGEMSSIKNVSGWANLLKIELPNLPTLYSIGLPSYGHVFAAELVKSVEVSDAGVTITLKGG